MDALRFQTAPQWLLVLQSWPDSVGSSLILGVGFTRGVGTLLACLGSRSRGSDVFIFIFSISVSRRRGNGRRGFVLQGYGVRMV